MPVPKTEKKPEVLHMERTMFLLEGTVQSRSDKDRQYRPRIVLNANFLCTCDGSIMRDSICVHLRALLENMDRDELVQFILDAQTIPEPMGDPE